MFLVKCTERENNFPKRERIRVEGWIGLLLTYGKRGTNVDEKFDSTN